ncbi:MAG: glycosyltransferase family protein [Chitinispirillaceae bacterium]|nr:glycosyltransferase family protein [Chitinispirillaceae bacterium]
MISVVTCYKKTVGQSILEKNIAKTVGVECEYIPVDGTKGHSMATSLNYGVSLAKGDIIVVIPEDVCFMKGGWGALLEKKFVDQEIAGIGVAGTQYLFSHTPSITAAGKPFIKGRFVYQLQNGEFFAVVYSKENGEFEVVACESIFLAFRKAHFGKISFDEVTYDGNYFAEVDLSFQLRKLGKLIVTTDILIKKFFTIQYDNLWREYGNRFLKKWSSQLPASCCDSIPDPANYIPPSYVNLHGKVSAETIC